MYFYEKGSLFTVSSKEFLVCWTLRTVHPIGFTLFGYTMSLNAEKGLILTLETIDFLSFSLNMNVLMIFPHRLLFLIVRTKIRKISENTKVTIFKTLFSEIFPKTIISGSIMRHTCSYLILNTQKIARQPSMKLWSKTNVQSITNKFILYRTEDISFIHKYITCCLFSCQFIHIYRLLWWLRSVYLNVGYSYGNWYIDDCLPIFFFIFIPFYHI